MEVPITVSMTISRSTIVVVPDGYPEEELYSFAKEQGAFLPNSILSGDGWNIDEEEVIKE